MCGGVEVSGVVHGLKAAQIGVAFCWK